MSVIPKRECSREVMLKLAKQSGYKVEIIEEVIDSVYEFIYLQIQSGSRETIRLPKLGSFQISKKREMNEIHNKPDGILNRKNTIGIYTNVNERRLKELREKYRNEFNQN